MADRPLCVVFRWERHHEKSQTTVSCVTGSVAYWLHVTSFQAAGFVAVQSHACNENRCAADYFICQDLQTHKENKPTRQAGQQPMHIVHSQSTGMCADTLIVESILKGLEPHKPDKISKFTQQETTWSRRLVTWLACESQFDILFLPLSISDAKFEGNISVVWDFYS